MFWAKQEGLKSKPVNAAATRRLICPSLSTTIPTYPPIVSNPVPMPKVFISYSNLDRARVLPYIQGLSDAGFNVWWDQSLRAGDDWTQGIERELDRADCIVIFWSHQSVNSPWVRIEAHQAKRKNRIVPVKLEDVDVPDEYRALQTLSVDGQLVDEFLPKLARSIRVTTDRNQRRAWLGYGGAIGAAVLALLVALGVGGFRPGAKLQPPAGVLTSQPSALVAESPATLWTELNSASTLQELADIQQQLEPFLADSSVQGVALLVACRLNLRRYEFNRRDTDLALAQSQCANAQELQPPAKLLEETRGWLALVTGSAKQAIVHFQKAVALDDRAGSAYLGLASAYEASGELGQAELAFSKAVVQQPELWRAHNELGLFLQRQGRGAQAIKRLQLALDLHPGNIAVLNNLGVAWLYAEEYGQAIKAWSQVLDNTPERDRGPTFTNIGSAYYLLHDFQAAKVAFQKASRLLGDDYRTWANLADVHRALGEQAEAATFYQRALDRARILLVNNSEDLHTAASALTFRSALQHQGWQTEMEQLMALAPDDAEFYRLAALAYVRNDQPELAITKLRRALELGYPEFLVADDYELGTIGVP